MTTRYFATFNGAKATTLLSGPLPDQPNMTEITKEEYERYEEDGQRDLRIKNAIRQSAEEFRKFRKMQFTAFDVYKTNLAYGIISENLTTHDEITSWYDEMLAFPETINESNYESLIYPTTPEVIAKYL